MNDEARLMKALEKVAQWTNEDPAFLPIFERLEKDLIELRAQKSALTRARLLASGQKDIGLSSLAA